MSPSRNQLSPHARFEIQGYGLLFARLAWVLTLGSTVLLAIYAIPARSDVLRFESIYEFAYAPLAEILTYQTYLNYIDGLGAVTFAAYLLVALFIFWRKSSDWLAIMTSICLLGLPFVFFLSASWDIALPGAPEKFWPAAIGYLILVTLISLVGLLFYFPTGFRVVPGPAKGLGWLLILIAVVVLGTLPGLAFLSPEDLENSFLEFGFGLIFALGLLIFGSGIYAQVYRYFRISRPSERQQTKWIIYGIALFLVWSVIGLLDLGAVLRFGARQVFSTIWIHVNFLFTLFFPFGLAISIFRYRLYEIDLIIRRTLQYGLLTGSLLTLYYLLVLVLQAAVTSLTGEGGSPVVLVISTLTIAAAFNPFRRRLQQMIDKRFFRTGYDTEAVLSHFANITRDEMKIQRLAEILLSVVDKTVRPAHTSIWILEQGQKARTNVWKRS